MEIATASVNSSSRAIELTWSDGSTLHYPFPWLRDNCQCNDCQCKNSNSGFQMRKFLIQTLDPDIEPAKTEVGEAKQLRVTWPDGHCGDYTPEWLYKRGFRTEGPVQYMEALDKRPHKYWGREIQDDVPTMQFDKVMTDDSALYRWIVHLEETGLCVLGGAPTEIGQLHKMASRVSRLYYTCYGETFQVKVNPDASNPAFTASALGVHTDMAALEVLPGVQMLHCVAQTASSGGVNPLVDGFRVAEKMERDYPNLYDILTTVPVYHSECGNEVSEFSVASKHPCIERDVNGELSQIHWSGHARESRQNHLPLSMVQPLYEAFCKFENLMMDQENCIMLKLSPGDVLCFHNCRVLHGRTAYTLKEGEQRHLEGGYLSWDDLRSKRRVLEKQLRKVPEKEPTTF